MKKYVFFVCISFICLFFVSCFSLNTKPILLIQTTSQNSVYRIKVENYINLSIPNKIMSFVFENEFSDISKIELLIYDNGNFNSNECLVTLSSEIGPFLIGLDNVKRINNGFIKIKIPKENLGKYNALVIAEKSKERIELRKLCQNPKSNLNKTLLYIQGTNPIPENNFSISLRPALEYLYPEYKNIYFYLYNMGFGIEHKVHDLAKSIKEKCDDNIRFDVIAESQGALVVRSMMLDYPELDKRIDKFISLCGPNEGVFIANDNFIADLISPFFIKSSTTKKDIYYSKHLIEALNKLTFKLMPELVDMREGSPFITELNSKMNESIANRLYLIGGTFIPKNEALGDLFAKKSSLMFESCELISDDRKFIYPYMFHPQVMFDKGVALRMHELLVGGVN